jgi:hypothetical protein
MALEPAVSLERHIGMRASVVLLALAVAGCVSGCHASGHAPAAAPRYSPAQVSVQVMVPSRTMEARFRWRRVPRAHAPDQRASGNNPMQGGVLFTGAAGGMRGLGLRPELPKPPLEQTAKVPGFLGDGEVTSL